MHINHVFMDPLRSFEMDRPWTTVIGSLLLNREKVAEGKGFEHGGAGAGMQCSRPKGGTHGPRALAWEGVTGTATNGSQRSPVFKTTDFPQLTTLHNS